MTAKLLLSSLSKLYEGYNEGQKNISTAQYQTNSTRPLQTAQNNEKVQNNTKNKRRQSYQQKKIIPMIENHTNSKKPYQQQEPYQWQKTIPMIEIHTNGRSPHQQQKTIPIKENHTNSRQPHHTDPPSLFPVEPFCATGGGR